MEKAREGEIARAVLKHMLKDEPLPIDRHFRRRIGNVAKNTGLPFAEVLEFATALSTEILAEVSDPSTPPTPEELEGFKGHGGH